MATLCARTPLAICALICALIFFGIDPIAVPANAQQSQSQPQAPSAAQALVINPDASAVKQQDLLRQSPRIEGTIVIPEPRESVLIQPAGRAWRFFHEVLLHWLTATSFVVLALTGLNITFGKYLLLPLLGPETFSRVSEAAKYVHNFVSFAFVAGLVLIVALWIKDNIPRKIDIVWLKEGGGFIGSKDPQAGRFNAGEKLVFWFALGGGAAVAVSGYLLLFPFYVTNIAGMQLAQIVHSLIAVFFIAVILGHIYIGTLGMEGAFEAMGTGSVDLNWAKEHHRLWLEDEVAKGRMPSPPPRASAAPAE